MRPSYRNHFDLDSEKFSPKVQWGINRKWAMKWETAAYFYWVKNKVQGYISRIYGDDQTNNSQKISKLLGWVKCFFNILVGMRHNSSAEDVFGEIVKVRNHTRLWDSDLVSYSLSAPRRICVYGLGYDPRIYSFRSAIRVKFIEALSYCTMINGTFMFQVHLCDFQITQGVRQCATFH